MWPLSSAIPRYQFVPPISNAQNDAHAIADLLRAEGFDVEEHQNLTNETLRRVVRSFVSKTRDAEVALIYLPGTASRWTG